MQKNFKTLYRDEYTDEHLPQEWVEDAIFDELSYFNANVWRAVPLARAMQDPSAQLIGVRWVICNKGDAQNPEVRARLVAQEVSHSNDVSFYAATPPLESKRMLSANWHQSARVVGRLLSCLL